MCPLTDKKLENTTENIYIVTYTYQNLTAIIPSLIRPVKTPSTITPAQIPPVVGPFGVTSVQTSPVVSPSGIKTKCKLQPIALFSMR